MKNFKLIWIWGIPKAVRCNVSPNYSHYYYYIPLSTNEYVTGTLISSGHFTALVTILYTVLSGTIRLSEQGTSDTPHLGIMKPKTPLIGVCAICSGPTDLCLSNKGFWLSLIIFQVILSKNCRYNCKHCIILCIFNRRELILHKRNILWLEECSTD